MPGSPTCAAGEHHDGDPGLGTHPCGCARSGVIRGGQQRPAGVIPPLGRETSRCDPPRGRVASLDGARLTDVAPMMPERTASGPEISRNAVARRRVGHVLCSVYSACRSVSAGNPERLASWTSSNAIDVGEHFPRRNRPDASWRARPPRSQRDADQGSLSMGPAPLPSSAASTACADPEEAPVSSTARHATKPSGRTRTAPVADTP